MGQGLLMTLREEHMQVKHLLDELKESSDDDKDMREEKFDELMSTIKSHMTAEEEVFYSSLKQERASAEDEVMEAYEEHHMAEEALGELSQMDKSEERWKPLLKVAREMIEHHIAEEQAVLFEHAEKTFSDSQLEEMEQKFMELRQQYSS